MSQELAAGAGRVTRQAGRHHGVGTIGGKGAPPARWAHSSTRRRCAAGGVQWYAHLFPAPYFLEIARGISLKGVGLGRLWPEAAILLAYGAALLAAASLMFRKKIG